MFMNKDATIMVTINQEIYLFVFSIALDNFMKTYRIISDYITLLLSKQLLRGMLMHKTNRPILKCCDSHYLIPALILFIFLVAGCSTLKLPPVASPATGVHHQGKFVWFDLLTDDVTLAKNFYGTLFDWSFKKRGSFTVVLNNGQSIGGIVEIQPKDGEESTPRWIPLLSVADVDQAVVLVKEAGGTIHEGPVNMPKRGRGALISDPQGAPLLLLHSSDGDPPDREQPMGSWLWIELWSDNPEASLGFYQELCGYSSIKDKEGYWILERDSMWRGGIRSMPDGERLKISCWIPVVRVRDTVAISDLAEKLGGRVLVKPSNTNDGSSVALIEDPGGALLIVQRWSNISSSTGE
jgi:predicted enzyme related to lactoylglutathione lyase